MDKITNNNLDLTAFKLSYLRVVNKTITIDLINGLGVKVVSIPFKNVFQLSQVFMCPVYPQFSFEEFPIAPLRVPPHEKRQEY